LKNNKMIIIILLLTQFTIIGIYSIPNTKADTSIYPSFYFNQPNGMLTHNPSVTISWTYFGGSDPTAQEANRYITGIKLIMSSGEVEVVLLNIGFNGTSIDVTDLPTSINIIFTNYFNNTGELTPIIFVGELWAISNETIQYGFSTEYLAPDNIGNVIIDWSPNNFGGNFSPVVVPSYVYIIIIAIGIAGIVSYILYRLYSCDNTNNLGNSRCYRSLLSAIKNIEEEKRINKEESDEDIIRKIDAGEMKF